MSLKVRKNGSWVPIGISAKGAKGEKGVKGNKGNKGLKGVKGSSGSQGFKGIKGNKGEKGVKGAKGEKGIKGAKGISGIEGSKGNKGNKGNKGEKGLKGLKGVGEKGLKGLKGDLGVKGEKGNKGNKGKKGELGNVGSQGLKGIKGNKGLKGNKGDKGNKGPKGVDAQGADGVKGSKGNKGLKGNKGVKGTKGIKGVTGAGTPIGQIVAWSGNISPPPSGYFVCDGRSLNKNTYSSLFAVTGYIHGGSGNNFNIPDLRDKFIVGAYSDGSDTTYPQIKPGATGGSADATLVSHSHTINNHTHSWSGTTNNPGNHTHSYSSANHPTSSGPEQNQSGSPEDRTTFNVGKTTGGSGGHTHSVSGTTGNPSNRGTNSQGSSATNANLPPYYALAYVIKYQHGGDIDKGEKGAKGIKGIKGNKGQKGEKGLKGVAGNVEAKGSKGNKGNKGLKGKEGVKGNKGNKGEAGKGGLKGIKGNKGLKGNKGASGIEGKGGIKGNKGNRGLKGISGIKGEVGGSPIGQIVAWSGSATAVPQGYFLCSGTSLNTTTYAALFNIIGYTHGGSGSTFNLPDLRDRFIIGAGGNYSIGNTGGSANAVTVSHTHGSGSYSTAGAGTHNHSFDNQTGPHGPQFIAFSREDINPPAPSDGTGYAQGSNGNDKIFTIQSVPNHTHSISGTSAATGVSATNANLPPYYALAYIIQYSQGGDVAKGEKGNSGQKGDAGVATKGEKGNRGVEVKGSKGSNIGGSLDYAHFRKSTSSSMVEDINVTNTAAVIIKFDVETFKGNVFGHNNNTNPGRVSVTGDGIYNITANIGLEDNQTVSDRPAIALFKNGAIIDSTVSVSSRTGVITAASNFVALRRFATLKIVHTLQLVSGDYIEVRGFRKFAQIQDGSQPIHTYTTECELVMTRSSGAAATSGSQGIQGPEGQKGNKGSIGPAGTGGGTPVGSIIAWPGPTIPAGWRLCDGGALNRTTYADLFNALGALSSPYGAPDNNSFYIPNCQSRFLVGVGQQGLGFQGGSNTATLQEANLPSHFHYVAAYQNVAVNPNVPTISATNQVAGGSGRSRYYESYSLSGTGNAANAGRSSFVGSGSPFNIIPLYHGVYWIIKITP
tara:strand:+ start:15777 stop:19094 length:3318 start_codon:yes stop_codon:yes gene_type:complete